MIPLLLLILVQLLRPHHNLILKLENHWDQIHQKSIRVKINNRAAATGNQLQEMRSMCQVHLGISRLPTLLSPLAIRPSKIIVPLVSPRALPYAEFTLFCWKQYPTMSRRQQLSKKHLTVFSPSSRIIKDILQKPNAVDAVNAQKVHHRVTVVMKSLKTSRPLNEQNLMTQSFRGRSPTSYMELRCPHRSLAPLSYSNSMLLIRKLPNDHSSILPLVPSFQIRNGPTFSQDVLSTLTQSSPDTTQHPTTMNDSKKSEISKFISEQSTRRNWFQVQGNGVSHGIGHRRRYVQHSHTGQVNLDNMLSTLSDCLLRLTCIFTIALYFLTKLFVNALVLAETWSSQISTNSSTLDQPIWTQSVPPSSNVQRSLPRANPLELLAKRLLNPATAGMRGCAHLRALSVAGFTFVANAFSLGTKVLTAHQNNETLSYRLHADSAPCLPTIFQPPRVKLGVAKK
jgi:hypothetical protein